MIHDAEKLGFDTRPEQYGIIFFRHGVKKGNLKIEGQIRKNIRIRYYGNGGTIHTIYEKDNKIYFTDMEFYGDVKEKDVIEYFMKNCSVF